jgi:hypothetical protein
MAFSKNEVNRLLEDKKPGIKIRKREANAKSWLVNDEIVYNLSEWCRNNGINYDAMLQSTKRGASHKNYKAVRI